MIKSENITEIAKSLAAAQSELRNTPASAVNPHFKSRYTPLDDILDMAREVLPKHGLSVLQSVSGASETITVTTMLMHTSGQWLESDPLTMKAERTTPQGQGSAITYARRYSLSAMLGVATDPDDDGNDAEKIEPKQKAESKPKQSPDEEVLTNAELRQLNKLCVDDKGNLDQAQAERLKDIYSAKGYGSFREIKRKDFKEILDAMYALPEITPDESAELPFKI